jgi:hypothetical protein
VAVGEVGARSGRSVAAASVVTVPAAVVAARVTSIAVGSALTLFDTLLIIPGAAVSALDLCAGAAIAWSGLMAIGFATTGVCGFLGQRRRGKQGSR